MSKFLQNIKRQVFIDDKLEGFIQKGLSGTMIMEIGAKLILFTTTLILTNFLSSEDYGRYSYYIGWIITLATIGTFGLDDYIIKRLGNKDEQVGQGVVRPAITISFLLSAVLAIFFLLKEGFNSPGVIYISLAVVFLTLQWMISSVLKGRKHILSAQISEQIIRGGSFLLALVVLLLAFDKLSFETVAGSVALAALCALIVAIVLLLSKESETIFKKLKGVKLLKQKEIYLFAALSVFGVFRHKLDVILLGAHGLFVETGIYNIASKLADLLLVGLTITTAVFMPLFAEHKETGILQKILRSSQLINLISGSILFLIFLLAGPWILSLFGEGFDQGHKALIILSSSTWLYALLGPYIIMLMMVGHAKEVLIGLIVGVVAQAVLAFIIIPHDPINGMAYAKGISIVIIQLFMMIVAWKRLGIKPFRI